MVALPLNGIGENRVLFAPLVKQRSSSFRTTIQRHKMFDICGTRIATLRRGLRRLSQPNMLWVSLSFFGLDEIANLRAYAESQPMRPARAEVRHKDSTVFQDFDICFPAPAVGAMQRASICLQGCINAAAVGETFFPDGTVLEFNDFAVQRYAAGSRGIGIHRDAARYRELVAIVTLAGQSRLFATPTRQASFRRAIDDRPGRLVLLSAPGFAGRTTQNGRPFHGVDRLSGGRLSLGLRCNSIV